MLKKARKLKCEECGAKTTEGEMLIAANPWASGEIVGCPECFAPNTLVYVCDEPGCWEGVCYGTPTETGYQSTCRKHRVKRVKND